jgi:hypothetical protein
LRTEAHKNASKSLLFGKYQASGDAMSLNEFLKAHRKLEQQQTTIERQQKQIDALTAGL